MHFSLTKQIFITASILYTRLLFINYKYAGAVINIQVDILMEAIMNDLCLKLNIFIGEHITSYSDGTPLLCT